MPIIIPNDYYNYRLISIDPGTLCTGIAIYELDTLNKTIIKITAFTIYTESLLNHTHLDEEYYSARLIKLYKLKLALIDLIKTINPGTVVCESPFYNRLRPMAYGALLETIAYIRDAVITVNSSIVFTTLEPLVIKKCVGAGFTQGKLNVKECVSNNATIMSVLETNIDSLDEHAIDAIACGYSFIQNSGVLY